MTATATNADTPRTRSNKRSREQTASTEQDVKPLQKVSAKTASSTGLSTFTVTDRAERKERGVWENPVQFVLSSLGLAVGLGNIWRFPALAYENGGCAFVVPYVICLIIFGLPMVYLEFFIGQHTKSGAATVLGLFAPALQGFGWASVIGGIIVSIFYILIVSWCVLFVYYIYDDMEKWNSCDNWWNDNDTCVYDNMNCTADRSYINGTCTNETAIGMSPSEQYFLNRILQKTDALTDIGGPNFPVLIAYACCWLLVWVIVCKGIKILGYVSYVATPLPYIFVIVLLVNGVMLDGAEIGLRYYILGPKWELMFNMKTWVSAITQICFSLTVGYGCLITMSSYNNKRHNCFRDALILIGGDTVMSIVGGFAVFSTLGFLSKQMNKPIEDVVQSGTELAFVVYPQALARMGTLPMLWSVIFFLMIILLGVTTEIGLVETICSAFYDQWPKLRQRKWLVSLCICSILMLLGLPLCFQNGIFIFAVMNEFGGSTTTCLICAVECISVTWFYGRENIMYDLRKIFGAPRSVFTELLLGPASKLWGFKWMVTAPVLAIVIMVFTMFRDELVFGKGPHMYRFPNSVVVVGYIIAFLPMIAVVVCFVMNAHKVKTWRDLFRVSESHPSYKRINHFSKHELDGGSYSSSLSRTLTVTEE